MRRFCSRCRAEFDYFAERCPVCGASDRDSFDEALRRALRHRTSATAAFAARVLAARNCEEAIPDLIEVSFSGEPARIEAALRALGAFLLDERVRRRLREARQFGTARERAIASQALEEVGL